MVDGYFQLRERRTNVKTGIVAGLTTFLTMAYIIFANADILSDAGMNKEALIVVTCLITAAAALIMVGLFMMKEIKKINFSNLEDAFPAFIIIVMIALSYSISKGLAFGFISFTVIKFVCGRAKEVKPAMCIIAILSLLFLTLDRWQTLIEHLKGIM